MTTSILSTLFLVLGVTNVSAVLIGWIVYQLHNRFTREVFLLFWFIAFFSLVFLSLGIIFDPNTFVQAFSFLSWELGLPAGTSTGLLFLLILWIMIVAVIPNIYLKWRGKKSVLQHEEEVGDRKPDIGDSLSAILRRDPARKTWEGLDEEAITPLIPSLPGFEKPWHIHAAEILMLLYPQYKITQNKERAGYQKSDWYPEEQCFLSTYGSNEQLVGIFCKTEEPSYGELERFSHFVQQQEVAGKPVKLLALIGTDEIREREMVNIVEPMEFRYKEELIAELMGQFHRCRDDIIDQYESARIEINSTIAVQDIYVAPAGSRFKRNREELVEEPIEDVEAYLKKWLQDQSLDNKRHIALLGEYGQGKSVLSLRIAYSILKENPTPDRWPIIFELRGASPRSFRNQLELLSVWAVKYDVSPKIALKLHELGRLLLIFEGFDEIDLVGDYEIRLQHFQKLWSFSSPQSKIIITGRPNFFLNDQELTTLLRTHRDSPTLPYCEELHLAMFDLPKIEQALRYKPAKIRKEIMDLLLGSPENSGFRDLMKRPTLLFIAGMIWEEEHLQEKGPQINSAFIMERFLEYSYKRQTDKLKQPSGKQFIDSKPILEVAERAYFMMGIAVAMAEKQSYTNQIKRVELNESVIKLIKGFDPIITLKIKSRYYKTSFQERIIGKDAKKAILRDIIACGVLVRDYTGEDLFKFAHKSFLEYLISRFYVSLLIKPKQAGQYQLIARTISEAIKIDLLKVKHTQDTAKFTGELLVNEASLSSNDHKEMAKKLFKFLYPVRILDRVPQIAFPTFKSFLFGGVFGGLVSTVASITSTLLHTHLGLILETLLFSTLFLFGLRRVFRIGEVVGILLLGTMLTSGLESIKQIPFLENSNQLFYLLGNENNENEDARLITYFLMILALVFVFTKLFLIKIVSKNSWNLIAFENKQIDKLLQLWVLSCEVVNVPDAYLLKFMSKRRLQKLKKM